jgi:hypothetical protein
MRVTHARQISAALLRIKPKVPILLTKLDRRILRDEMSSSRLSSAPAIGPARDQVDDDVVDAPALGSRDSAELGVKGLG